MELPAMYTCPCCSYRVFADAPGSYDICPICFWEDDIVQLAFPGLAGGANKCSLFEGQQNFEKIGACEERIKAYVRPAKDTDLRDSEWRPLDMGCDQFLKWENREDHQLWQKVKDRESLCLYYWLPDYWLLHQPR
jgi:hypothetical protein